MNNLYLAYYKGKKSENPSTHILDRIICFFTFSRYSHVELVYQYSNETKYGCSVSSSPRDGGVRFRAITFDPAKWELFQIETDKNPEDVVIWFNQYKGFKYDWLGAVGVVLAFRPFSGIRNKRWFCSEIIGTFFNIPMAHRMSPQDIFNQFRGRQIRIL